MTANASAASFWRVSGLTLPNGLGWDVDDTVMYLADSVTHTLLRAPYRPDEGALGDLVPVCTVDAGLPDGLAVDVEGCVWLAVWGGWAVHRYTPEGKDLDGLRRTLRPLARSDKGAWRDARRRNVYWLRPWDATPPPGTEARPASYGVLVRRLHRMAR